jgi:FkbM family methyltransferase
MLGAPAAVNFRPLDIRALPWYRRALLPLRTPVNRALRWLWAHSSRSRSTWFDSRLWRAVWNVNRLFAATPRAQQQLVEVRFAPRIVMQLDLSRLTDVLAFCYGAGEMEVGHACARLCAEDAVVVDVGGNIGTTALHFAATVPQGLVHVFEPSPAMLACLRRNIVLSGADNVVVHPFGLADAPARGQLQVATPGNPGSAFFVDRDDGTSGDRIEVRCLDDVLRDSSRVDFVKIDVEGLELRVLRGARATLLRHRPTVVFEVNDGALARAGTSGAEVCRFLQDLGYRFTWLDRGVFRPYEPQAMLGRRLHNVIAVPAEPAARRAGRPRAQAAGA